MLSRGAIAVLLVGLLVTACGRTDDPEARRLSVGDDVPEVVDDDGANVEGDGAAAGSTATAAELCATPELLRAGVGEEATATPVDGGCGWRAADVAVSLVSITDLAAAVEAFQEVGRPVAAPAGLGAAAVVREDPGGGLVIGVFTDRWALEIRAREDQDALLGRARRVVARIESAGAL